MSDNQVTLNVELTKRGETASGKKVLPDTNKQTQKKKSAHILVSCDVDCYEESNDVQELVYSGTHTFGKNPRLTDHFLGRFDPSPGPSKD